MTTNDGQVWVVVTMNEAVAADAVDLAARLIADVEVLDQPPKWDLAELHQVCFTGNVNGGDTTRWHPPQEEECPKHGMTTVTREFGYTGFAGGRCYGAELACGCTVVDESGDLRAAE